MSRIFSAIFIVALLFTINPSVKAAQIFSAPTHTLHQVDQNNDVLLLQMLLNISEDTQVSQSGVGSKGAESNYFGAKTTDAVKRFQNKYASEILTPQGLKTPTGVVGNSTLSVLQRIVDSANTAPTTKPAVSSNSKTPTKVVAPIIPAKISAPVSITPLTADMKIPAGVNPNSINIEYAITQILNTSRKQGVSELSLKEEENNLRTFLATTTDFRKEFFQKAKFVATSSLSLLSLPATISDDVGAKNPLAHILVSLGIIQIAHAGTGVPFGGFIVYAFPCPCSGGGIWYIIVKQFGPTFVTTLTYTIGTELYLWHNIPLPSTYMIGYYIPLVQNCWMPGPTCWPLPVQGWITPQVGSSSL